MDTINTKDNGGKNEMADIEPYNKLQQLVTAANQDKIKPKDLHELKRFLQCDPKIWRAVDLENNVVFSLIKEEHRNEGAQAIAKANYDGIRNELGYEQSNTLERMIIDHIALCWLHLQYTENRYIAGIHGSSVSLPVADYWERRMSSVQKRYLKALETLAKIKRLRLPAMQVNIADKQVNISGD